MTKHLPAALCLLAAALIGCDGGESGDGPVDPAVAAEANAGDAELLRRMAELERENAALRADAEPEPPAPPQATADAAGITAPQYTDTKLNVVPKDRADWVREATFREPVMATQMVPSFDGYPQFMANDTGMGRFDVLYRWVGTGQPAMQTSATAMMNAQAEYTYSGPTVWYDEAGQVIAKGTLKGGKIVGTLEKYDAAGNVTATETYDGGRKYDPNRFADADSPLIGTWVDVSPSDHAKDGTRRLFNVYGDDGRVTVYAQQWSPNWRDEEKLDLNKAGDPGEYAWTWRPDDGDATQGTLEWYDGLKLIARCKLVFDGPERFASRVTFHVSPQVVGSTYDFRREIGPGLREGVVDGRLAGDWVQDEVGRYETTRLFNNYAADGTVAVYEETWARPMRDRDGPRVLQKTGEPATSSWTYEPKTGMLNWLRDGRVRSRAEVTFDGPGKFTEEVVFHEDVNQIGKTYSFRRHDGGPPEEAAAAE